MSLKLNLKKEFDYSSLLPSTEDILWIPVELANDFIVNPLNSLRDFACEPTNAIVPFFTDVDALDACLVPGNPFDSITRTFDEDLYCNDEFFRYMHVDLAYKKDGIGISMCHIPEWRRVKRVIENKTENLYEEIEVLQPFFKFDFVGRIVSDNRQEMLISTAQDLILELSYSRNYYIHLITFDRFESVQTIQNLREKGFNVSHLSVDRTAFKLIVDYDKNDNIAKVSTEKQYNAAMEGIRYAVMETRMEIPEHEAWEGETRGLEYDAVHDRVVKSPHSSDDLIQSIAGSAFNAANNEEAGITESVLPKDAEDTKYEDFYNKAYDYSIELDPSVRHPYHQVGIV